MTHTTPPALLILPPDPHDEPQLLHADGTREIVAAMSGDPRALSIALATLGYLAPDSAATAPLPADLEHVREVPVSPLPATPCPGWCLEPQAASSHYADADRAGTTYRAHQRILSATETASVTLTRTDRMDPFTAGRPVMSVLGDDLEPADALRLAAVLMDASDLLTAGGTR